ncbi:hypothetical protein CXU09_10150 [Akkermansia muciniphila]|uniref:Uncharacterized protein n=1 Tax=Akkermansia muciniphila TaxID=239935 RepID=A0AAP8T8L5_9BACT|nr:hypothetical protein CXU09_10150 [Akkermansia muciniphila]
MAGTPEDGYYYMQNTPIAGVPLPQAAAISSGNTGNEDGCSRWGLWTASRGFKWEIPRVFPACGSGSDGCDEGAVIPNGACGESRDTIAPEKALQSVGS